MRKSIIGILILLCLSACSDSDKPNLDQESRNASETTCDLLYSGLSLDDISRRLISNGDYSQDHINQISDFLRIGAKERCPDHV